MRTPTPGIEAVGPAPGFNLLLRLRLALVRNRLGQMVDQSPLKLLLVIFFVVVIWGALFFLFDTGFRFLRRFDQQAAIAVPYVFHIFFVAMTVLLAFSTAVLVYGSLFNREEPSFLLSTPNTPSNIVTIMYLESLFFASWSLVLLGVPLMLAFGRAQGMPWHFYFTFVIAFLGFVPIPGAFGLLVALAIALWLPRQAKRILFYATAAALGLLILWWGRLWVANSSSASTEWLQAFLGELQYLKGALLPSTWVTNAIRHAVDDRPGDAAFYLAATVSTGLFFSWAAISLAGAKLLAAFGRASTVQNKTRPYTGKLSSVLTQAAFFYAPANMRALILKDVRMFLRDPVQWSQLAILFGLLGLYLTYLPRSRPEGFDVAWRGLICFLNFGAVTLILSTFTSRFVFPMVSQEGQQMWLVALWPLPRKKVMWAKFAFALTITGGAAMSVTYLSIRALDLPLGLALIQGLSTLATCIGLCGMAVGLGARLPNYHESNSGRIASGLGGTINLIASVALVAVSVCLFGLICYDMVGNGDLNHLALREAVVFAVIMVLGLAIGHASMWVGIRSFNRQEF